MNASSGVPGHPQTAGQADAQAPTCTCPSGDGSLRWPCPAHPSRDASEAPSAAPSDQPRTPVKGEWWTHRNGISYRVMHVTNTAHVDPAHPPDVVYEGPFGHVWSRRLSDWHRSFTPRTTA